MTGRLCLFAIVRALGLALLAVLGWLLLSSTGASAQERSPVTDPPGPGRAPAAGAALAAGAPTAATASAASAPRTVLAAAAATATETGRLSRPAPRPPAVPPAPVRSASPVAATEPGTERPAAVRSRAVASGAVRREDDPVTSATRGGVPDGAERLDVPDLPAMSDVSALAELARSADARLGTPVAPALAVVSASLGALTVVVRDTADEAALLTLATVAPSNAARPQVAVSDAPSAVAPGGPAPRQVAASPTQGWSPARWGEPAGVAWSGASPQAAPHLPGHHPGGPLPPACPGASTSVPHPGGPGACSPSTVDLTAPREAGDPPIDQTPAGSLPPRPETSPD